ncbi:hypothetical protein N7455_012664 [Penicillium solitum]|uniref:uncharacterized protein n=1 Tax=Penicillium solitum TaxID=60172 RepID=UPI0032C485BF|nr:hypothetical protein N7455_012664 [Penicillium solitum]
MSLTYKRQSSAELPPISSHGLVVKRMTSNHEILGSTPKNNLMYNAGEQQAKLLLAWLSGKAHDLYIPIRDDEIMRSLVRSRV